MATAVALAIGSTGSAEAGPPITQIEYTILPPTGSTPKAAPFDSSAGAGDRIRITATSDRVLSEAPTISIYRGSYPRDWEAMRAGPDPNTWTYEHTVDAARYLWFRDAGAYTYSHDSRYKFQFQLKTYLDDAWVRYYNTDFGLPALLIDDRPPTVMYAGFTRPDTIHVRFSELIYSDLSTFDDDACTYYCSLESRIRNSIAINGLEYRVTAPDGTNMPDDSDDAPDEIALLPSGAKYSVSYSTRGSLHIKLQEPAVSGVMYALELPASLADRTGNRFQDRTVYVEYTAGFTAKTVDATTTIVTFSGDVGGSIGRNSWTMTSDREPAHPQAPYHTHTYKGLTYPSSDSGSGKQIGVNSVTLGPREDAPTLHFNRKHWAWVAEFREGADSPSSWSNWNVLVGIPDTYAERSLVIKHWPLKDTSTPFVSYLAPWPSPSIYMHPGTGDASAPPYFVPWNFKTDISRDRAFVDSMTAMRAGGAVVQPGLVRASDGWPPAFTSRLTSSTTTLIEFSEPVSGTARIADWGVAGGTAALQVQSVRTGAHSSPEAATDRAASTALSAARFLTLTHEAIDPMASQAVSYTHPAPTVTDALADDAGNYVATKTVFNAPTDTTPPTFTARTVGATLVEVTFGEPVSGAVVASEWKVGGTVARSLRTADGSVVPALTLSGATSVYLVTSPLAHDARPAVEFMLPKLADAAGNALAASTVTAADGTAPIIALASTTPASTVTVTFSEPVSGTTGVAEWTVGGLPPTAMQTSGSSPAATLSLSGTRELTLVIGADLAPDSRPAVTYTPADPPGITDTVAPSAPSHETATPMAAQSLVAADGIAPTVTASITGPNTITLTFDEALASPEWMDSLGGTVTVPDDSIREDANDMPDIVSMYSSMYSKEFRTLTIRLYPYVVAGIEYTVSLPAHPTDVAGNAAPRVAKATLPATAAPTFTALTKSPTLVEVAFVAPVSGAVSASQWTVGGTVASSLLVTKTSTAPTTTLNGATTLTLVTAPLAPDARPKVKFAPPSHPTLADASGNAVAAATVAAADGIAPSVASAVTASPSAVVVTFSEDISGQTQKVEWRVGDIMVLEPRAGSSMALEPRSSGPDVPWKVELSGARELTLVTSTDLDPDSKPNVTYTPIGSRRVMLTDTVLPSSPPNERAVIMPSQSLVAADGIAPTATAAFTGPAEITVTFDEALASPGTIAGLAYAVTVPDDSLAADADDLPDTVTVSASAYDAESRALTLTLAAESATGVLHTVSLPPAGLVDEAGNAITQAIPGVRRAASADPSLPTFTARTVNATLVKVAFSEPVSGAVAASQWTVAGTAASSLRASQDSATEATSLSGATALYLATSALAPDSTPTVSFAPPASPTLADSDGNAVAAAMVRAADGIAPTIASASPSSPSEVTVTFSEALGGTVSVDEWAVDGSRPAAMRVSLGANTWVTQFASQSPLRASSSSSIVLVVDTDLTSDSRPAVSYAPGTAAADPLADAAGNPLAAVSLAPSAPAAFTARTLNATLVEVAFESPVSGAVAASQWTVAGTAASSLRASQDSTTEATSLSGATSLYLVAGPLAADSRPTVAFTPPAAPTLARSAGSITAATVTAADGIAPTIASASTAPAT